MPGNMSLSNGKRQTISELKSNPSRMADAKSVPDHATHYEYPAAGLPSPVWALSYLELNYEL